MPFVKVPSANFTTIGNLGAAKISAAQLLRTEKVAETGLPKSVGKIVVSKDLTVTKALEEAGSGIETTWGVVASDTYLPPSTTDDSRLRLPVESRTFRFLEDQTKSTVSVVLDAYGLDSVDEQRKIGCLLYTSPSPRDS